jgi:hypothetical protein
MKSATQTIAKKESRRIKIRWTEIDDLSLLRFVIDRSDFASSDCAWRELLRRYAHVVDERIDKARITACRMLLSPELRDEIRSEYLVSLLDDDMAKLRGFDPKHCSLGEWLARVGERIALRQFVRALHFDAFTSELVSPKRVAELSGVDGDDREFTEERQAGARWLARGR